MKKKTTTEFIKDANKVHNGKYDYSLVDYINNATKVKIICPTHGVFEQKPSNHLSGKGCPKCKSINLRKVIYKNYYNDYNGLIWDNEKRRMIPSYIAWRCMINRCESKDYQDKYNTYIGCSICKDWHSFSKFKSWYDANKILGWNIDKDLIVKNNKLYSPKTCCFLPPEINSALTYRKHNKGKCVVGVSKNKYGTYVSNFHKVYLGVSNSEIEMFYRYKKAKEDDLKKLAEKYKQDLSPIAYRALYNFKIEIND